MSSKRIPAALLIASCFLMDTGTLGAPVFTTVVLDDFVIENSYYDNEWGWSARIGPEGHVAYFGSSQLRVWNGAETGVLHRVGGGMKGLKPSVSTGVSRGLLGIGPASHGQILGIDRYGGITAAFAAEGASTSDARILASTTPDGDFRAIMALDHLADDPSVIRSRPTIPAICPRRTASGATLLFDIRSTQTRAFYYLRVFTPELDPITIATSGTPAPGAEAEFDLHNGHLILLNAPYAAANYDIADSGAIVYNYRFSEDGWMTQHAGVARRIGEETQVLARSDVPLGGVEMPIAWQYPGHPAVRINNSGDTLLAGWFSIDGGPVTRTLMIASATSEAPQVIAEFGETLHLSNFGDVVYNPANAFGDMFSHDLSIADDGSLMFGVKLEADPYRPSIIHRRASGEMSMLLAPDPALLGVSDPVRHDGPLPILSLDGSSAGAGYFVGDDFTIFHATESARTRVLGVGDLIELSPGDERLATAVELLDVYGQRVLVTADFDDGTRGLFSVFIPECRADMNRDGVVDADDFFLYLQLFAAGDPRADINDDGVINADDFFEYLDLFAAGC